LHDNGSRSGNVPALLVGGGNENNAIVFNIGSRCQRTSRSACQRQFRVGGYTSIQFGDVKVQLQHNRLARTSAGVR
jgi:hypothetical protein